jgi:hypothetical protein
VVWFVIMKSRYSHLFDLSSIISLVKAFIFCYLELLMKTAKLITINQAAKLKSVSRQAIHAAIKTGRLKATEVATTSLRITPEALAAFVPNPKRQECGRRHV